VITTMQGLLIPDRAIKSDRCDYVNIDLSQRSAMERYISAPVASETKGVTFSDDDKARLYPLPVQPHCHLSG